MPPPSYPKSTSRRASIRRTAHQGDRVVTVEVHPVQRHQREEVSDVQGGCGGVDADICSDPFPCQEPVEGLAMAVGMSFILRRRRYDAPSNILDKAPLLKNSQHALVHPGFDPGGLFLPLHSACARVWILAGPCLFRSSHCRQGTVSANTVPAYVGPQTWQLPQEWHCCHWRQNWLLPRTVVAGNPCLEKVRVGRGSARQEAAVGWRDLRTRHAAAHRHPLSDFSKNIVARCKLLYSKLCMPPLRAALLSGKLRQSRSNRYVQPVPRQSTTAIGWRSLHRTGQVHRCHRKFLGPPVERCSVVQL